MNLVCGEIVREILGNQAISIKNFGTLSPYRFHGHKALDVSTGIVGSVKPFRTVRFHPHAVFLRLMEGRRDKFRTEEKG